jgi:hypothetical protein
VVERAADEFIREAGTRGLTLPAMLAIIRARQPRSAS